MTPAYGEAATPRQGWPAVFLLAFAMVIGMASDAAAQIRLLVLGDSLTAGFGLPHADGFQATLTAALAAKGIAVTIIDGAVSGDTSAGGLARLDWLLDGGPAPEAAIIELGANDGLRGLDPLAMERNLTAIMDKLAGRHVKILLSGMYPLSNFGPEYRDAFRGAFGRLSQRPGILYDSFFLEDVAMVPALIQPDGLHPNAAGVARIVERLLPLVMKLLAEAHPS